jgi:hypothetical protein
MQIFFDKTSVLDVTPEDTIGVVKAKIQVRLSVHCFDDEEKEDGTERNLLEVFEVQ